METENRLGLLRQNDPQRRANPPLKRVYFRCCLHALTLVHRDINPAAYSEPPRRNADLPSNTARICFRGRPAEPGQAVHPPSVKYKRARKQPNSSRAERRRVRWFCHPKGIVSSSPGLPSPRGYPGLASVRSSTPTGLRPRSTIGPQPRWGWPTPPAFPRVARGSQPWALGRNPFGIQRWNFRKAGAQILAALDYKSALRHSSCGQGHLGGRVAERSAGLIRSDLRFQRFHPRVVGLGGG